MPALDRCRPVVLAVPEIPLVPGEDWLAYRRRARAVLALARRRGERIPGLRLAPLLAASAFQGWATEEAFDHLRGGAPGGMRLLGWGEEQDGVAGSPAPAGTVARAPQRRLDGHGVAVAVLDSGIDAHHPYLAVAASVSACPEPAGVPGRHGTHCAGIIAARGPGCVGIAPACRLLDVKVARSDGSTSPGWLARGVDAALDLGADVLSMSCGLNLLPAATSHGHHWICAEARCLLCRAVDRAVAFGVVVVAAAGNERLLAAALRRRGVPVPAGAELRCPARARGAIAVGALGRGPAPRSEPSSSQGQPEGGKPEILAPGQDVVSTVPPPRRFDLDPRELVDGASGSSAATAFVAGVAALAIGRRRLAALPCSPAEIRRDLLERWPILRTAATPESVDLPVLDGFALAAAIA